MSQPAFAPEPYKVDPMSAPPPQPQPQTTAPMAPPLGTQAVYPPAQTTVVFGGQPHQQQPVAVVMQAPPILRFDKFPLQLQCPSCHQTVTTRIVLKNGMLPWIACGGLTIFGCFLGCCLIPFCIEDFKDAEHYCPSCNNLVGVYRRLG